MKSRFALNLAQDGISLLYRMADGWAEIGHAMFDDSDFDARLAGLKSKAAALAPDGITTKLIIPDSQILYSVIDAPGPDSASRRAQILAALEGRTPYPVEDLVFDWSRVGGEVSVAVVAKLTLDEAEDFAESHGMNPVSFVAIPAPGQFAGEPFFGQSRNAERHLPQGERLTRDQDPVKIIATPAPVAPEPVAEAEGSEAAAATSPEPAAKAPEDAPAEPVAIEPSEPEITPEPDPDLAKTNIPAPEVAAPELMITAAEAPDLDPDSDESPAAPARVLAEIAPASDASEAPFIALEDLPDLGPESDAPAPPAFSSRRLGDTASDGPAEARGEGRLHLLADPISTVASVPKLGPAVDVEEAGITAPVLQVPASPQDETETSSGTGRRPRSGLGRALMNTLPEGKHGTQAQQRARRPNAAAESLAETGVFGASNASRGTSPARLRLGLILVAVLLLLMAATALWSAWFVADPDSAAGLPAEAPALAETPAVLGAPSAEGPDSAAEAPGTETTPGEPQTANAALPLAEPDAAPASPEAARPPAPLPDPVETAAAVSPEPEPDPGPATPDPATLWDEAPAAANGPEADASGAPVVTTAAPGPEALAADVTPLPAPDTVAADEGPAPQPLPPPYGTEIEFGPDGLIRATPDGVVTPDGFTLISGKPPVVPAPAPRPSATPEAPSDQSGNASGTAAPPAELPADQAAGAVAEAMATPALPDPVDPAHAALKPRARPAAVVQRAEASRAQSAAIAAAAEAAARAEAEALASASSRAVTSSRRPSARPAGLSKAVEAAVAAAVSDAVTSAVTEAVAAAPAPAAQVPEEIDEPEPTKPAPNMPTSVTVSKQATVKNAIDLGKINLIGVYGSSASRRALVRMPTGRLIKVKVGDRLDGGKVAAIGDSELTYVKNGRSYTLKIVQKS